MKKTLLYLMMSWFGIGTIFAQSAPTFVKFSTGSEDSMPLDTIAKINFTYDSDVDEPGWINVYGSESFPVDLTEDISMFVGGGKLNPGAGGELATIFPPNVGMTYSYIMDTDEVPVLIFIDGLDPAGKYNFEIFASREHSATGDRTTYYSIDDVTVSINPIGNTDSLLVLSDITPSQDGEVVITMTKNTGTYGYINSMVILKKNIGTSVKDLDNQEKIGYFPIPVKDILTITNLSGNCLISVYDIQGRKILNAENFNNKEGSVSLARLNRGIYIVRITNKSSVCKTFKIIKQ